jgi:SAM-dependent methyltransferase
MPGIEQNQAVWTAGWDWSQRGEEWSRWWGGSEAMWFGALLPRIHPFVPAPTVLEIGPGYGRWTHYLKEQCDRLVVVDLAANCIEHCRRRFAQVSNIEYHVNDGRSLEMIPDCSIDFAFSFDSLVHAELDVVEEYLSQLAQKLTPHGVAYLHHSNAGSYRTLTAVARRVPARLLRPLIDRGVLIDLIAWRAESVTADAVARHCERVGLACVSQEKISWEFGAYLIDTLSTVTPLGSRWQRPRVVMRNPRFRSEAERMANLYSRSSYPRAADSSG